MYIPSVECHLLHPAWSLAALDSGYGAKRRKDTFNNFLQFSFVSPCIFFGLVTCCVVLPGRHSGIELLWEPTAPPTSGVLSPQRRRKGLDLLFFSEEFTIPSSPSCYPFRLTTSHHNPPTPHRAMIPCALYCIRESRRGRPSRKSLPPSRISGEQREEDLRGGI